MARSEKIFSQVSSSSQKDDCDDQIQKIMSLFRKKVTNQIINGWVLFTKLGYI